MIKYSFIIPVKDINDYIRESIPEIFKIDREDFEIIIYPDNANNEKWPKTRQIASGPGGPAMKRTLAMKDAQGEIIVFIDDDAYPDKFFLNSLDIDFNDDNIVAVGGPALTPANDNFWQKVSGAVFLSRLSGGCPERYISIGKKRFIDDWPSVNLAVRKESFKLVGGFQSEFWPGEDTLFCYELIKQTGKKILYDPDLLVWHHRRQGLRRHLKQVGGYGLHRGFFVKKYPETSFKLKYFLPSLFLTYIVAGAISSIFSVLFFKLYLVGFLIYCLALAKAFFDIKKHEKNLLVIVHSIYYIFFTHIVYGYRFLQGLIFTKALKSKLR